MSTISNQQEEEYQFSNQSDDDSYSTGGDSGFSMGQDEDEKLHKMKKEQQEPEKSIYIVDNNSPIITTTTTTTATAVAAAPTTNFFSRLASIPIIQDSFIGAQNIVRQHSVGQKALDYAETKLQSIVVSAQPYLPTATEENNNTTGRILSRANNLGNKSLDLLERQFPAISSPTNQLVQPITGRIESAVSHLREKKTTMVDPRIDYIANGFESLINQYLPKEEEEEEKEKHGMDRLMHVVNILSTRASKKISKKASATVDEEREIKQMIRSWVLEQTNLISSSSHHPIIVDQMSNNNNNSNKQSTIIQVMYNFTQTEFDKVRQELNKPNISHMDRIRNILVLSQTDILLPLIQKSRSIIVWKHHKEEEQVPAATTAAAC